VILAPVEPSLHFTVPAQPLAVKVALAPLHKLLLLVMILGAPGVIPVVMTIGVHGLLSPQVLMHVAV
jgi:hypothetical protein